MQTALTSRRLLALCVLHFAFCIALSARAPQAAQATVPDAPKQLAAINAYCVSCHNDRVKTGGVSFENLKPEDIGQRGEVFEKAVRKLRHATAGCEAAGRGDG
jgi:cytochrome c551/c552